MRQSSKEFMQPNAFDRFINRAFGFLVKMGFGLSHNFLLEVHGRKSGRVYSTPVNVLEYHGRRFLVAPRGYTEWVKNILANGEATLVKGTVKEKVGLRAIANEEKPELLKVYLDRFKLTAQRYFPIPAGAAVEEFESLAARYPVFELTAKQ